MTNYGQICVAPDYVFVPENKYSILVELLKKNLDKMYNGGKSMQDRGKIINYGHYKRICSLMEDHGGEVIFGNPNSHNDLKLELSAIKNPRKDSKLMQDEIFGPLLPILTYKDMNEVIDYINEKEKPLALYWFGN